MPQKNKLAECLGCLTKTPMRYGDMTGDGAPEIVLFLGDSMVIFSTKVHKVIFSTLLDLDDAMPWQDQIDAGLILDPNDKASPQYGSKVLYENVNSTSVGYRGYAKIYLDDFNNDTKRDIVMWRKFYQSRLKNDATSGFEKVRDTWVHYSLDGGEYKLQATDSTTIKNWLKTSKLTWQKGFPSTSECAGQKGQLIPEMHNVLLNDPDVLQ